MDLTGIIIITIIGVIIIFLICRELVCWYWKINKMVELINEQNLLMKQLISIAKNSKSTDKNSILTEE